MATRAELEAALNNPNARKFLDLLSYTEGTQKNGYATAFGGGRINDLSRHPKTSASFTQTDGKKNSTTAAGRYQFLGSTWDEQSKKLGLSDFGAKSQDLAALSLAADSGALKSILAGDFKTAIDKTGTKWASLPSSPYPQGKKSWDSVNKFLGSNYTPSQASASMPSTQIQPPAPPKAELAINTDYTKPFDLNQYNIDSEKSIFGRNLNRAPQTAGTEAVQPIQIQQEAPMNTEPVQQAQSIPQQQFQITPFNDVSYGNQQDIALQSIQPQTSDPMYKYIENIWDGTDIAPEEYMNG